MRKQAAWGLFLCLCLFSLGFYQLNSAHAFVTTLHLVSAPLLAGISLIFLLVLVTHPRRGACRFYATIISFLSFTGLALTLRHLWTQIYLPRDLPNCDASTFGNYNASTAIEPVKQIITGIDQCLDSQTLINLPLTYLFFCVFFLFSVYSIFLLFRRIERDIFR